MFKILTEAKDEMLMKYRSTNGFRSGTKNFSEPDQPRAVDKGPAMSLIEPVGLS